MARREKDEDVNASPADAAGLVRYQWCDIDQDQHNSGPLADEWFYLDSAVDAALSARDAREQETVNQLAAALGTIATLTRKSTGSAGLPRR